MPIGKDVIYIVQSESLGGDIFHELSFQQLLYWMDVLTKNDVNFKVLYRFDDKAKQFEFNFL